MALLLMLVIRKPCLMNRKKEAKPRHGKGAMVEKNSEYDSNFFIQIVCSEVL